MEHNGPAEGYEAVPMLFPAAGEPRGNGVAVLRRHSTRRSNRAVLYVHCLADEFVVADLARWYTDRGFHFYAADLRAVGSKEPAGGRQPSRRRTRRVLRLPRRRYHSPAAADAIETLGRWLGAYLSGQIRDQLL